jgi:hypothetical protein
VGRHDHTQNQKSDTICEKDAPSPASCVPICRAVTFSHLEILRLGAAEDQSAKAIVSLWLAASGPSGSHAAHPICLLPRRDTYEAGRG